MAREWFREDKASKVGEFLQELGGRPGAGPAASRLPEEELKEQMDALERLKTRMRALGVSAEELEGHMTALGVSEEGLKARVAAEEIGIEVEDVYTFHGFLAPEVDQPGVEDKSWRPLYLDLERRHVMYLENDGILGNDVVEDRSAPGKLRDILWVRPNTTVGVARAAQSIEGQFLSGQFTRAADFRDSPAGGTIAAATGVFCEGDSIGCCRPTPRG